MLHKSVERLNWNPGYLFLILIAFVIAGFYYPYFSRFPHFTPNITPLVHIHATALMLWVVLLVAQPLLIRFRKYQNHRRIGIFTYLLVPVIVVTSVGVMIKQFQEGRLQNMNVSEDLKSLFTSIGELVQFTTFYSLAIIYRRNIELHMRYMILTGLALITPALARVLGYWFNVEQCPSFLVTFLLIDAILAVLIVVERQRNARHRPYPVALMISLIFHFTWFALGHPTGRPRVCARAAYSSPSAGDGAT